MASEVSAADPLSRLAVAACKHDKMMKIKNETAQINQQGNIKLQACHKKQLLTNQSADVLFPKLISTAL
jgi:hypothetical protein